MIEGGSSGLPLLKAYLGSISDDAPAQRGMWQLAAA
jgi:hypothetical protein